MSLDPFSPESRVGFSIAALDRSGPKNWRNLILSRGPLVTVHTQLRVCGGPLHFERAHCPDRGEFDPFHNRHEPDSKQSLSKYGHTEMPADPGVPDIEEIKREAAGGNVNHDTESLHRPVLITNV